MRNHAVLDHLRQHAVARPGGAVRVALHVRVAIRRADNPAQKRAFRQRQFANILAEIGLRCFRKSVNREAAAIAQIHFVDIQLKNLLFRKALLEQQRHVKLGQLAPPRHVVPHIEEKTARHLHGDGAGAAFNIRATQMRPRRANNAQRVEPRMLEEALIFRRAYGVHQQRRQIREAHKAPLLPRAVK